MRRVGFLLGKDLRTLSRSPALVVGLLVYPLFIALLVALVVRFASERPRVAFVDLDRLPEVLVVGGQKFDVDDVISRVETEVDLVPLGEEEAEKALANGDVVASITVPRGFASRLRGMIRSPVLVLKTTGGGLSDRVERQTEALVYNLNRQLQDRYIDASLGYVETLREGGRGTFLGNEFDVIGLKGVGRILAGLARTTDDPDVAKGVRELRSFVGEAMLALAQSDETLRATANPIEFEQREAGESSPFGSAELQGAALALTLAFLCMLVASAGIAAERDENTVGRLARGLVRLRELVAAKVALAVVLAVGLGVALATVFGIALELGASEDEPWQRLPLLAVGLALAGAAFGGLGVLLGVLARESRTASFLTLLVALPIVLLGFLPEVSVAPAAWISEVFPFVHSARFFESALYGASPWGELARESIWLLGLAAGFALAARAGVRRLLV
jgi:ABC-type multidrug transport system permease subunit